MRSVETREIVQFDDRVSEAGAEAGVDESVIKNPMSMTQEKERHPHDLNDCRDAASDKANETMHGRCEDKGRSERATLAL